MRRQLFRRIAALCRPNGSARNLLALGQNNGALPRNYYCRVLACCKRPKAERRRATLLLLETYGVAIGYTIAGPSALCRNMRLVSDSNFEHPTRQGAERYCCSMALIDWGKTP